MRISMISAAIGAASLALLSACVVNAPPVAEKTPDGLVRVQSKQMDSVYAVPGGKLDHYQRVILEPVNIAFKLDWQKRHPEVSESDVTRIRSQGAAVFHEIFSAALSRQHGYGLTTQPGPDVLRITASITELDVSATTSTGGNQRVFVVSPGDLTLLMELRDSTTGALLVRATDREKGRASGDLRVDGAVENSAEARKALEMWANLLRGALDNARGTPQAP